MATNTQRKNAKFYCHGQWLSVVVNVFINIQYSTLEDEGTMGAKEERDTEVSKYNRQTGNGNE